MNSGFCNIPHGNKLNQFANLTADTKIPCNCNLINVKYYLRKIFQAESQIARQRQAGPLCKNVYITEL